MTSAAEADGVLARLLRLIPSGILVRIYNILMWCRRLLKDFLESRTVFLPKQKNAEAPEDFRPITIPLVLVRSLHKILAKRMKMLLDINLRQRVFRSTDGCADNTFLLDTLLRYHRTKYKPLYMAALDINKAFDLVSYPIIIAILKNIGVPSLMVKYLTKVYTRSKTRLEGEDWIFARFHPSRGIRQGDPLSPIALNTLTHQMLQLLPSEIDVGLGGTTINAALRTISCSSLRRLRRFRSSYDKEYDHKHRGLAAPQEDGGGRFLVVQVR